jgi:hypothetical protein
MLFQIGPSWWVRDGPEAWPALEPSSSPPFVLDLVLQRQQLLDPKCQNACPRRQFDALLPSAGFSLMISTTAGS